MLFRRTSSNPTHWKLFHLKFDYTKAKLFLVIDQSKRHGGQEYSLGLNLCTVEPWFSDRFGHPKECH